MPEIERNKNKFGLKMVILDGAKTHFTTLFNRAKKG